MTHRVTNPAPPVRFAPWFALLALAGLAACSTPPAGGPNAAGAVASHATSPPAGAPLSAGGAPTFTGTVAETMNSGGYTYVRLQSDQQEVWVATVETEVVMGQSLTVVLDMPMENFHSSTLDRDFPVVYFVATVGAGDRALPPVSQMAVEPQAPPEGGLSIADVWARRASLAGTSITVRGTVVKVNTGILGSNWLHLQDGSGVAGDGTHDLAVTTSAVVSVGDVVTVTGTLSIDKDFGAGYAYGAILENATIRD